MSPRFQPGGALTSRDPSSRTISVRLSGDQAMMLENICAQHGLTISEFLRELIVQVTEGRSGLQGADEGYKQARVMGTQLAFAALRSALEGLPEDPEEAAAMVYNNNPRIVGNRRR